MKFADTVLGLLRRWYIVFPGLLIAASVAVGAWFAIPPDYNRSATQLLLPGQNSIPEGGNPYLFLGGLAPAADVLVRALGSENVINEVVDENPGIDVEISRDTTTAGPIILITVTATSDDAAEGVLDILIDRTTQVLAEFQEAENIPEPNRITVIPVTVDEESEEQPRSRVIAAAGAGLIGTVLTLLVAGLVDGSSRRRRDKEPVTSERNSEDAVPGSPDARVPAGAARTAADVTAPSKHVPAGTAPPVADPVSAGRPSRFDLKR